MDWIHTDQGYCESWRADLGDGEFLWVRRQREGTGYVGGLGNERGGSIVLVPAQGDASAQLVQWRLIAKLRRYGAVSDEQGKEWAHDR